MLIAHRALPPLPPGIAAGVFLGGTLLLSMWKVSRDPEQRRRKTMNKNKARRHAMHP